MSTDIELLPLPEGVDVIFSPDGNGAALDVFTAEQVQDYAHVNVARATEPLIAEIEALKSDLHEYQDAALNEHEYGQRMLNENGSLRARIERQKDLIESLRVDVEAWKASHSMLTDTCHHFQSLAKRRAKVVDIEDDLVERLRLLEQDHEPDGWPAVRMRDITALLDALDAQQGGES